MRCAPAPQNFSLSGSPWSRLSALTSNALKSSTHSQTSAVQVAHAVHVALAADGGERRIGRLARTRTGCVRARPDRCARRRGFASAAAANSHSYQVGRRACSLSQYACAANQLTWVTGCCGSAFAPERVGVLPVRQVARFGEHRGHLAASPFGMRAYEGEELGVGDRRRAQAERRDLDRLGLVVQRQHAGEGAARQRRVLRGLRGATGSAAARASRLANNGTRNIRVSWDKDRGCAAAPARPRGSGRSRHAQCSGSLPAPAPRAPWPPLPC